MKRLQVSLMGEVGGDGQEGKRQQGHLSVRTLDTDVRLQCTNFKIAHQPQDSMADEREDKHQTKK